MGKTQSTKHKAQIKHNSQNTDKSCLGFLVSGLYLGSVKSGFCEFRSRSQANGFTMVEIVVMLSIVTAISAVVLFSFAGLNEGAALNRSARELALAVRKAQNMAIAVTEIPVGVVNPTNEVPLAVGIKFSLDDQSHYFLFAERSPLNFKYDGDTEKIVGQDSLFDRNVKLNRLIGENGQLHASIHIIFAAPEADIVLTDINGNPIPGDVITLELSSLSGQTKKTVVVRTSGQVSIK